MNNFGCAYSDLQARRHRDNSEKGFLVKETHIKEPLLLTLRAFGLKKNIRAMTLKEVISLIEKICRKNRRSL